MNPLHLVDILESLLSYIIHIIVPIIISVCELMGIFVVSCSAIRAFGAYCKGLWAHTSPDDVMFDLATGLATSLEFKMAAEILKTVLVQDLSELVVLGAVVLLRALLSLLIHFEMKAHYSHAGEGKSSHDTAKPIHLTKKSDQRD